MQSIRSDIIAVLALIASMASPFVAYFFLDPKIQELKHAPKIKYSESEIESQDGSSRLYQVELRNVGDEPATGAHVVIEVSPGVRPANAEEVHIAPPAPAKVTIKGGKITVAFDHGMKYMDRIVIAFVAEVIDKGSLPNGTSVINSRSGKKTVAKCYVFSDQGNGEEEGKLIYERTELLY